MSPEKSCSVGARASTRFWRIRHASCCSPRESPVTAIVIVAFGSLGAVVNE